MFWPYCLYFLTAQFYYLEFMRINLLETKDQLTECSFDCNTWEFLESFTLRLFLILTIHQILIEVF